MEHREEMNCGGDLCKEMLDVGDGQIAARNHCANGKGKKRTENHGNQFGTWCYRKRY